MLTRQAVLGLLAGLAIFLGLAGATAYFVTRAVTDDDRGYIGLAILLGVPAALVLGALVYGCIRIATGVRGGDITVPPEAITAMSRVWGGLILLEVFLTALSLLRERPTAAVVHGVLGLVAGVAYAVARWQRTHAG